MHKEAWFLDDVTLVIYTKWSEATILAIQISNVTFRIDNWYRYNRHCTFFFYTYIHIQKLQWSIIRYIIYAACDKNCLIVRAEVPARVFLYTCVLPDVSARWDILSPLIQSTISTAIRHFPCIYTLTDTKPNDRAVAEKAKFAQRAVRHSSKSAVISRNFSRRRNLIQLCKHSHNDIIHINF